MIKAKNHYNKNLNPLNKKEIIIPTSDGKNGNPILFSIFMKKDIMNVSGDSGAKNIIEENKNKILKVPFEGNGITLDFDTQENFNFS